MDYWEHIEKAIDYIEENLQYELTLADCARVSGYSPYHFLRIFRDVVGLTPADYIRKRRISEISKEIIQGNRCIAPIAFQYGFNSKENFVRAFKMEHHILPTEYKEAQNSLKLYERFRFEVKDFSVIPRIVIIQSFFLTVYKCDEEVVPNFWNKYNAKGLSQKLSGGKEVHDYGVSDWNHEKTGWITISAFRPSMPQAIRRVLRNYAFRAAYMQYFLLRTQHRILLYPRFTKHGTTSKNG